MDYSPPDSSVGGISQARILEWVACFFSRESSWQQILNLSPIWQPDSIPLVYLRSLSLGTSMYLLNTYILNSYYVPGNFLDLGEKATERKEERNKDLHQRVYLVR